MLKKQIIVLLFFSLITLMNYACDSGGTATTGYYNVEDYGANGSDQIDDTIAIQKAINEIKLDRNRAGVVFFPAGTYLISEPIHLDSYISLIGEPSSSEVGGDSVIKAIADMSSMVTTVNNAAVHLGIENLTFDAGEGNNYVVDWVLDLYDFIGSRIANIKIYKLLGGGIRIPDKGSSQELPLWSNFFENIEILSNGNNRTIYSNCSDSFFNGIHSDGGMGVTFVRYGGVVTSQKAMVVNKKSLDRSSNLC